MHGADIVEFERLFSVRRTFLLCCENYRHRVHRETWQKQCCREEQHDQVFSEVHFLPWFPSVFLLTCLRHEQEERFDSAR